MLQAREGEANQTWQAREDEANQTWGREEGDQRDNVGPVTGMSAGEECVMSS